MEGHLKWNVTQIGMSLKLKNHLNWNVTQTGMSIKLEYYLNLNITQIIRLKRLKKVLIPKTSNSTSIGWILILFKQSEQTEVVSLCQIGYKTMCEPTLNILNYTT